MKKILVVEENANMRDNIVETLKMANYDVISSESGKEAVRMAKEKKPDLILCDIIMPEMDGYEVLYLLNQDPITASIPFIFVSSMSDRDEVRKGMLHGADDYIIKPFDPMDLLSAIDTQLKKIEELKKSYSPITKPLDEIISLKKGNEELTRLSTSRPSRTVKKKKYIYMEGDEVVNVYYIHSGKVKTFKVNDDGKVFITGLHSAGDFFGSFEMIENEQYKESAVALEDCKIIPIPKNDFYALLYSHPEVSLKFIRLLSNEKEEIEELLMKVAFNSVRKRVADSLIRYQKKYEKENTISILISRTDLAGLTGIAPETVSRTLGDFKKENLIDFKDKHIIILNRDKLANMKD